MKIKTGYLSFGKYHTYYRIVGEPSPKPPLVLLHGGPGSTHNYFEILDQLAQDDQRQLIMYDQLGCGLSSIPDETPAVYNPTTWVRELIELRQQLHLDHIHLLGQSWGGMLAIIYLCDYQPTGIQSVILASTLSSAQLWSTEQHRMIKLLPQNEQAAIANAEQAGNYQDPGYLNANAHYMRLHCADEPTANSPECLRRTKNVGTVAYQTAWGPNEYTPLGNLRNYDYTKKLPQITIPALITSGTNDLCTPIVAKTMADQLPNATWQLFENTRHMSFVEKTFEYKQLLKSWLNQHDS
ncbi:proline iminopeptidase [uncultured Limosilactobacillus sp.]|uniref:proline iminopeptidase n=1 Tax=uncultured Limosilactobacillus sp. TaxID=2837629 RepID=UPI0025EB5E83|nr:proline iminopeptidase-family hydrolase [uncultured Limosilactobacillus sp.]